MEVGEGIAEPSLANVAASSSSSSSPPPHTHIHREAEWRFEWGTATFRVRFPRAAAAVSSAVLLHTAADSSRVSIGDASSEHVSAFAGGVSIVYRTESRACAGSDGGVQPFHTTVRVFCAAGEVVELVSVENSGCAYVLNLQSSAGCTLRRFVPSVPPMGWSTWNTFKLAINETLIRCAIDPFLCACACVVCRSVPEKNLRG